MEQFRFLYETQFQIISNHGILYSRLYWPYDQCYNAHCAQSSRRNVKQNTRIHHSGLHVWIHRTVGNLHHKCIQGTCPPRRYRNINHANRTLSQGRTDAVASIWANGSTAFVCLKATLPFYKRLATALNRWCITRPGVVSQLQKYKWFYIISGTPFNGNLR